MHSHYGHMSNTNCRSQNNSEELNKRYGFCRDTSTPAAPVFCDIGTVLRAWLIEPVRVHCEPTVSRGALGRTSSFADARDRYRRPELCRGSATATKTADDSVPQRADAVLTRLPRISATNLSTCGAHWVVSSTIRTSRCRCVLEAATLKRFKLLSGAGNMDLFVNTKLDDLF